MTVWDLADMVESMLMLGKRSFWKIDFFSFVASTGKPIPPTIT